MHATPILERRFGVIAFGWIAIGLLCGAPLHAQHWSDGLMPGADWAVAKAAFDSTWTDSLPERGKGVNPFQRWWHFAERRWAFDGAEDAEHTPFRSNAVWLETAEERAGREARLTPLAPLWQKATPEGIPAVGGAGRVNRVVIHPLDTSVWVACAPSGGVWKSTNSGGHWSLLGTADWAGMGVSDVAFHPEDSLDLLVATGDSDFGSAYGVGLMRSSDGGASWSPTPLVFDLSQTHTVSRVHRKAGAPAHILTATSDGIWVSEDDGGTFTQTLIGLCSDLVPHPGDPEVWYALLRPGEVQRSTDGGWSWSAVNGLPGSYGISRMSLAVSPTSPGEVWVVAAKASTQGLDGVFFSPDSGHTFTELPDVPNLLGYT
ncbi:MAG: WD40/YVTN/BNR-like repeat-containing protein, partial [Flavobacteriales bacterium]